MKRFKLFRSLFSFLLAAAMLLPAVPAVHAASDSNCATCGTVCTQIVLKQANCHEQGVVEYICVNSKCADYNKSVLVKTDIDRNNHDTICTDNGDGETHTASCRYHESYQNVKEDHSFVEGYCTKCGAADYSQAGIVLEAENIELYADLYDTEATMSIGKVSIMVGNVDITKNYTISYSWYDENGKIISTEDICKIPKGVTEEIGNYSYACFVMALPKSGTAGKHLSASCMVTLHVQDMVTASAIVGSREESFALGQTNSVTSTSVLQQIYQAVYEGSEGYPAYVVFDKAPDSSVGQLLVGSGKYYFVGNDGQKKLGEVEFVPEEDGAGNYVISFTAYDNKGKSFPGVLTISVERELGTLDVAYFAQKGEEITLSATDFELFWQEHNPGGELKQILFLDLPFATEGTFYYNYNPQSTKNTVITDDDFFHVVLSSANQYLIDGVTFVPAGKFTGQITVPFNAFGLSGKGYYVQKTGELSIFINGGEVEDVTYSMTSGNKLTLDADDFLEVYNESTGSKNTSFSIKLLDVPQNGSLYIDYAGTIRDTALTAEAVSDYTFYYSSALSREIEDLTYVSEKSNKAFTDTLRYVVCDSKGEFVYMGEIVFTCKSAVVVYTKSFTDVKKGDWFYTYVMDLAEANIINGFEETVNGFTTYSYKPDDIENYPVTYGQALKLIMLAAGYEEQAPTGDHWASGYLKKAVEDKLISNVLTESGLDTAIRRRVIAQIAARAMELPTSTRTESPLKDVAMTDVYTPYILSLYDAGIVTGDENGLFKGADYIKRSEMAAIVWRIYNYEA